MAPYYDREMRPTVKTAVRQGWTLDFTKSGHVKMIPPAGGAPIFASKTPSDHRSLKNFAAQLRRAGVKGV